MIYNKRIKDNIKTIKKLPKIKGVKKFFIPGKINSIDIRITLKKRLKLPKIY